MKTREEIINNMCHTMRHDYGLRISEDDRMYTLMSGMTDSEAKALHDSMTQIFDNDIAPTFEEFRRINEGELITLPKSKEHAEAMIRVAQFFLATYE